MNIFIMMYTISKMFNIFNPKNKLQIPPTTPVKKLNKHHKD